MKPNVSSLVATQEAPTPTISNRGTPTKNPPRLFLSEGPSNSNSNSNSFGAEDEKNQNPTKSRSLLGPGNNNNGYANGSSSSHGKAYNINGNGTNHSSASSKSRRPRFSSPTETPIVMHHPLSTPTMIGMGVSSSPSSHPRPSSSLPYPKDSKLNAASFTFAPEPTLATGGELFFDFASLSLNSDADGNTNAVMTTWTPPFVVLCDLVKTGLPLRLLQHAWYWILWSIRNNGIIAANANTTTTKRNSSISIPPTPTLRGPSPVTIPLVIKGLPNFGQTCFLNSVLQALASLEPFVCFVQRIIQVQQLQQQQPLLQAAILNNESNKKKQNSLQSSFGLELYQLLQSINGGITNSNTNTNTNTNTNNRRLDPRPLLQTIGETNKQFHHHRMEQQDAQELLQALMDVLITQAQLDSQHTCIIWQQAEDPADNNNNYYDSDNETLTTVLASEESMRQPEPDWSPANSTAIGMGNLERVAIGGADSTSNTVMSLSGLLKRMDATQKEQQQQFVRNKGLPQPPPNSPDAHRREEKKQEDYEISVPFVASEESLIRLHEQEEQQRQQQQQQQEINTDAAPHQRMDDSTISDNTSVDDSSVMEQQQQQHHATESMSMQMMKSTISSMTPSPLSGWLGSTLRCCNCKHVRPIQNAHFLDIPLVPTSVPNYLANAHGPNTRPACPSKSPLPSCSLDQCLADFTSVERVQDVECRNCTIQTQIQQVEEEAMLLQGAMDSMWNRISKKGGSNPQEATKYLRDDLTKVETRLALLRNMDPDQEDPSLLEGMQDLENLEFLPESSPSSPSLERCEAKKCLLLTRRPAILCCHIQRRYFDPFSNRMEKCVQFVEFPLDLDLAPYCAYGPRTTTPWAAGSSKQQGDEKPNDNDDDDDRIRPSIPTTTGGSMPYRLMSIVEHRGNAHGGHYVSYRRDHSGEWFRISDANVTPISWRQVRTCQAYMLFYEAI